MQPRLVTHDLVNDDSPKLPEETLEPRRRILVSYGRRGSVVDALGAETDDPVRCARRRYGHFADVRYGILG